MRFALSERRSVLSDRDDSHLDVSIEVLPKGLFDLGERIGSRWLGAVKPDFNMRIIGFGAVLKCADSQPGFIENRFFKLPGQRGDVRLSFLGMQGNGHRSTLPSWSGGWQSTADATRGQCAAGRCKGRTISLDNVRFVQERLVPLNPDVVVFAPGPWMSVRGEEGRQKVREVLKAIREAVSGKEGFELNI